MTYSLFTHGTALQIESPTNLYGYIKRGWGTDIIFHQQKPEVSRNVPVQAEFGPGSWFHISFGISLEKGKRKPLLESVSLYFESHVCSIRQIDIYDKDWLIDSREFNLTRNQWLSGLESPNSDIKHTFNLSTPHKVFSAISISFYACVSYRELGRVAEGTLSTLSFAAAEAEFYVNEPESPWIKTEITRVITRKYEP